MGYTMFFGCLFIGFSPLLSLFTFLIAQNNILIILTIGSAFSWLIGMFIGGIIWYILVPIRKIYWTAIILSVFFQEISRFFFFTLYNKSIDALSRERGRAERPLEKLGSSLACGVGFGFSQGLLLYASVLAEATGPGSLFLDSCPNISVFLVSAILCLLYSICHCCWAFICFDSYRKPNPNQKLFLVSFLHLAADYFTVINVSDRDVCGVSFGLLSIVMIISLYFTKSIINDVIPVFTLSNAPPGSIPLPNSVDDVEDHLQTSDFFGRTDRESQDIDYDDDDDHRHTISPTVSSESAQNLLNSPKSD